MSAATTIGTNTDVNLIIAHKQARLLVLLLFAWPLALLGALGYALLNPLSLIERCRPLTQLLLRIAELPLTCTRNLVEAKQLIMM